jgi:hypothetical protein
VVSSAFAGSIQCKGYSKVSKVRDTRFAEVATIVCAVLSGEACVTPKHWQHMWLDVSHKAERCGELLELES